jgi:hypothetical protein
MMMNWSQCCLPEELTAVATDVHTVSQRFTLPLTSETSQVPLFILTLINWVLFNLKIIAIKTARRTVIQASHLIAPHQAPSTIATFISQNAIGKIQLPFCTAHHTVCYGLNYTILHIHSGRLSTRNKNYPTLHYLPRLLVTVHHKHAT